MNEKSPSDGVSWPDLQHFFATVVASSEDAILTKILDGTIRSWNPGAESLYGYSAEEMIGANVAILARHTR